MESLQRTGNTCGRTQFYLEIFRVSLKFSSSVESEKFYCLNYFCLPFLEIILHANLQIKDKGLLGRRAVAAQSGYMAKAVNAHGVDRHLLGLRLSIKPSESKPAIFTDPSFARSCHWNISTSQITSEYYDTWGWGEVVSDGYGIAYMIKDNCLHFNLTSLFLKNDVMEAHIHSAVEEMRVVFEATIPPKAKL